MVTTCDAADILLPSGSLYALRGCKLGEQEASSTVAAAIANVFL
jgi:hypothetical protein